MDVRDCWVNKPVVHLLAALTAKFLRVSSLLELSVVVISLGNIPGRMQLTRIFILRGGISKSFNKS